MPRLLLSAAEHRRRAARLRQYDWRATVVENLEDIVHARHHERIAELIEAGEYDAPED